MTEKRKMNDFRMNNLAYIQAGDYYIPDIRLQPIEEKELGKYGRNGLWKDYWKRIRHWRKRRMPWLG